MIGLSWARAEGMYGASPDLFLAARSKEGYWKTLLKVLQSGASKPTADEWQVRAQLLRILAHEALVGCPPDSPGTCPKQTLCRACSTHHFD